MRLEKRTGTSPLAAFFGVMTALLLLVGARQSLGESEHRFVVLREHAAGTASRAQPFLDQLLAVVAEQNRWQQVWGRYFVERSRAFEFIAAQRPEFGILSLGAFLDLKQNSPLRVIGEVVAPKAGGSQYFLVSVRASDLASCKGQRLATTYAKEQRFVERVVARGAFALQDFEIVEARRPLQPLKQVLRGEAVCALIDDAQLDAARHIEKGSELEPVWQSVELPGMPVVAFRGADAESVASLRKSLPGLCAAAPQTCSSVGIELIRATSDARYSTVWQAYSR